MSTYPSHKVHRYRRVSGVTCQSNTTDALTGLNDVSFTTCRYLCDEERHRPCVAFTYKPSNHQLSQRVDGRDSSPRCHLMSTLCELVSRYSRHIPVIYIKGPLLTESWSFNQVLRIFSTNFVSIWIAQDGSTMWMDVFCANSVRGVDHGAGTNP